MKRTDQQWRVELGAKHWQRHTHAGFEEQGFQLLGRVSRAGQFGALAQAADGAYVQINGDHVTPLNRSKAEHALRLARQREETASRLEASRAPAVAPMVTVKRRRIVVPGDALTPGNRSDGQGV
jgi:hypothetical protein